MAKRKMSAAQKAALAKGRAAMAAKRKRAAPKAKRSAPARKKRAAPKAKRAPARKKRTSPIQRLLKPKRKASKGGSMARKKSSTKRPSKRRRRSFGGGGRAAGVMGTIKEGMIGVGGGLLAGFVANKLPVADARIKALAPVLGGIALAATLGRKNKIAAQLASGMVVIGGLSTIRNFFPNVPMLAGEEEVMYLPNYSGENIDLAEDYDEELMGGQVSLAGEPEYLSPADVM